MNIPPLLRRRPLLLAIALAALVAGVLLALQTRPSEERALEALQASLQSSMVLPADFRQVPEFTLTGVDGEPLTESVFEDRWTLLFFGFTSCPDVCPMTLSVVKNVVERLEKEGVEPPQVVFVTVDPVRDTAARMKEYVAYFDESFVGVSGEQNALHELTRTLGIVVAFRADEESPEDYTVDHTASMLLVDPERRLRAKLTAPHEVEPIVADYLTLRAGLAELN